MRYDYRCEACGEIFEANHGMNEKPRVKCSQCGSLKTSMAFLTQPMAYIRGYGYLDKEGRRRDMNLYKLTHEDPYKKYRQKGEASDLAENLRRGGRKAKNRKHFMVSKPKRS